MTLPMSSSPVIVVKAPSQAPPAGPKIIDAIKTTGNCILTLPLPFNIRTPKIDDTNAVKASMATASDK